ncbi:MULTISPECIES: hypothetical protein [Thiomicrorhabdus]|uniref:Uncharacterized protein n=1 Tax=Thiomicrorhabdus heinhorstiae TaxID=2748010 RepID=A0ABS0BVU4_9GAMM|nr:MULTISPECIES: hypothetical protein [Thiomicrorhabdus]MBF6057948.1 hypothetical protein [Thiomicrorhabdus heinhorstiae]
MQIGKMVLIETLWQFLQLHPGKTQRVTFQSSFLHQFFCFLYSQVIVFLELFFRTTSHSFLALVGEFTKSYDTCLVRLPLSRINHVSGLNAVFSVRRFFIMATGAGVARKGCENPTAKLGDASQIVQKNMIVSWQNVNVIGAKSSLFGSVKRRVQFIANNHGCRVRKGVLHCI